MKKSLISIYHPELDTFVKVHPSAFELIYRDKGWINPDDVQEEPEEAVDQPNKVDFDVISTLDTSSQEEIDG